jgi:hypothetical protein
MCYERRSRVVREQAREEGRQVWDLFDRETETAPPRPVAETEQARKDDETVAAAPERQPVTPG